MKTSWKLAAISLLVLVPTFVRAQGDDVADMRRQILAEAVMSENEKIRGALQDLKDEGLIDRMIQGEFLPGETAASEKAEAALAVLDQEGFWADASERASMSFPGAEFLGLGESKEEGASDGGDSPSKSSASSDEPAGEFSEAEKKQLAEIATAHFAEKFPAWPRIHVTGMWKDGAEKVVRFMPENKMGVIMFMATYKVWIDGSGKVSKMK